MARTLFISASKSSPTCVNLCRNSLWTARACWRDESNSFATERESLRAVACSGFTSRPSTRYWNKAFGSRGGCCSFKTGSDAGSDDSVGVDNLEEAKVDSGSVVSMSGFGCFVSKVFRFALPFIGPPCKALMATDVVVVGMSNLATFLK